MAPVVQLSCVNVTGFSEANTEVGSKRLGLLVSLVPQAERFGVLVNPRNPLVEFAIKEAETAAASIARPMEIITAATDNELDTAFANLVQKRIDALLVATPDPFLFQRRAKIIVLAARHAVPATYWDRAFPDAGGLMSYGSSVAESFRIAGTYAGRILKATNRPTFRSCDRLNSNW